MKTNYLILVAILATTALFSCSKENPILPTTPEIPREESTLKITITSGSTKATEHGDQTKDNTVQVLDIFVFIKNIGQPNDGALDGYQRFTGSALNNLTDLPVKTTTGTKTVVVVANPHKADWKGITTLNQFNAQIATLQKEESSNYTMTAKVEQTVSPTTNISLALERLISRVVVNSIKTKFVGTPYEGTALTDVEIYLINVAGNKLYLDGSNPTSKVILNKGKLVGEDMNNCAMVGTIHDKITPNITDAGYTTSHYLYCYENTLTGENGTDKFTRLVIEGKLNGTTYYYPININQENYGYSPSIGHKGVKRNNSYAHSITITRPGSLDPDKPVEKGTLITTLSVLNWVTVPVANIEF